MLHGTRALARLALVLGLVGSLVTSVLLVAGPAQAQKIRPDYWGMHDSQWQSFPGVPVGSANLTTSATYWDLVERQPRDFYWGQLDLQVSSAERGGAQPMIVLGRTPKFHSSRSGSADYQAFMPRMKAWKRYVTKVGKRYGGRLDYQIWPEPNITQNWKGSPGQMAKLTAVAGKVLSRVAPKAKVVSPAMAVRLRSQRKWVAKFFRTRIGGKPVHRYLDAVALDPFPEQKGQPEDSFKLIKSTQRQLRKIGVRGVAYWNNEINYGVAGGGETTTTSYPVDRQQSYVIRTYALSAAAGMRRTYWLGWFKTDTMAVSLADDAGRALQPGQSYAVVRSWMNKTKFGNCRKARSGLWTCTMRKGRKEVRRIYWKQGGKQTVRLPRSAKRVENQEGGVDTSPPRKIRVTYRPIMVASRK